MDSLEILASASGSWKLEVIMALLLGHALNELVTGVQDKLIVWVILNCKNECSCCPCLPEGTVEACVFCQIQKQLTSTPLQTTAAGESQ